MRDLTQPGSLPLRPLTTGELLDAAVVLVRLRGWRLIGLGFIVALVEQVLLFPLRRLADVDATFLPATDRLGLFGFVVMGGMFTEVAAIAVLGGLAARQAPRALLGWAAPARPRPGRLGPVLLLATIIGVVCAATGWGFLVLPVPLGWAGLVLAAILTAVSWPFVYGPIGLAPAAAVVDELGPVAALGRSLRLSTRNGMRAAWIRVLGYLTWLLIRVGLAAATLAAVNLFVTSPSSTVDNLILGGAWLIVNTLAYPTLGCLDVALHLESRMRTEGLDIALRRTVHRGVAPDTALAVPRATATATEATPR